MKEGRGGRGRGEGWKGLDGVRNERRSGLFETRMEERGKVNAEERKEKK